MRDTVGNIIQLLMMPKKGKRSYRTTPDTRRGRELSDNELGA
jgi:hypothetical protein